MKKSFSVLLASLLSLTAFAQGKIGFVTDSLHLACWPNGQAVNDYPGPGPGFPGIAAYLYMGTSSSQLFLYSSASFSPLASGPGKWTLLNVQANANPVTGAPAIPSGSVFVDVAVLTTEKAAPNLFDRAAFQTFEAYGTSVEFSFLLGTSVTYPVLYGPNSQGTWPIGTLNMDQYGTGSRGAIIVEWPEPGTFALFGVGGVAMMMFRKSVHNGSTR
jgi:hypothetical protein